MSFCRYKLSVRIIIFLDVRLIEFPDDPFIDKPLEKFLGLIKVYAASLTAIKNLPANFLDKVPKQFHKLATDFEAKYMTTYSNGDFIGRSLINIYQKGVDDRVDRKHQIAGARLYYRLRKIEELENSLRG